MNSLKKIFRKVIPKDNRLYALLSSIYHYRFWKPRETNRFEKILQAFNGYKCGGVFFIQIGSNDGLHGDPICELVKKNKWHGILVEPITEIFEKLRHNYRENNGDLMFENIAISGNKTGVNEFYSVSNEDNALPEWVNQLSSFDKNVILKHAEYHPEIIDRIVVKHIRTDSFENMVQRNRVQTIDLIHIDTEGYDFEILKQIDIEKYQPGIIIYEHKHLDEKDYKSSISLLKENRYKLFMHNGDTLAVHCDLASMIKIS